MHASSCHLMICRNNDNLQKQCALCLCLCKFPEFNSGTQGGERRLYFVWLIGILLLELIKAQEV